MNYLLKAALTTAIVGGLSVVLMVKAMGGDHNVEAESHGSEWQSQLVSAFKQYKTLADRKITIRYCGTDVNRAKISRSVRRAYTGVRPNISPPQKNRDYWKVVFVFKNDRKARKVFFTCPDGGSHE